MSEGLTKLQLVLFVHVDGEIVSGAGEGDLEGVMEGEEGGGWEVGDDDLDLPPDLVSRLVHVRVCV